MFLTRSRKLVSRGAEEVVVAGRGEKEDNHLLLVFPRSSLSKTSRAFFSVVSLVVELLRSSLDSSVSPAISSTVPSSSVKMVAGVKIFSILTSRSCSTA